MLYVIILTNNDEAVIADCLDKAKELDGELIVIDSNSKDRTPDIARMMGARVVQHEFKDFATQRNFAIKQVPTSSRTHDTADAPGDFVLYLDSDEHVTEEFVTEVKSIIETDTNDDIGGYYIPRKTYYFGKDWGLTDQVQRLFKKSHFIKWEGVVHETPHIKGSFGQMASPVLHFTHRDLSQMVSKTNEWSEHEAQLRFDASHPSMTPLRFIRVMLTGFFDSYIRNKGYKNGTHGFIEGMYQGFSMFITYAKLWEKQEAGSKSS